MDAGWDLINVHFLYPGLAGGLVHAFRPEKTTPWRVIGTIVTGGITGNILAPIFMFGALKLMTLPIEVVGPVVAFGIGLGGKKICFYVEMIFTSQKPLGKTRNE